MLRAPATGSRATGWRQLRGVLLVPVRARDDLHPVPARVREVDAAAPVVVVDPPRLLAVRVGEELHPRRADLLERRVELGLGDEERVVLRDDRPGGDAREVEGDTVGGGDGDEGAPLGPDLKPQDVRQELGGLAVVPAVDDQVVQLDGHG